MSERQQEVSGGARPSTVGTLVYMLFGLIVWAVQFTTIYMTHTLVCTVGAPGAIASTLVVVVSAATAIGLVFALVRTDKLAVALGVNADAAGRTTYDGVFRILAILSVIAIVWTAATAFVVMAC